MRKSCKRYVSACYSAAVGGRQHVPTTLSCATWRLMPRRRRGSSRRRVRMTTTTSSSSSGRTSLLRRHAHARYIRQRPYSQSLQSWRTSIASFHQILCAFFTMGAVTEMRAWVLAYSLSVGKLKRQSWARGLTSRWFVRYDLPRNLICMPSSTANWPAEIDQAFVCPVAQTDASLKQKQLEHIKEACLGLSIGRKLNANEYGHAQQGRGVTALT
jgi:hypothetical protein